MIVGLLHLLAWTPACPAQTAPAPARIEVKRVRRIEIARIRLIIRNDSGGPLYVPDCGESGSSHKLCISATRLEIRSPDGWKVATPAPGTGVLGGSPLNASWRMESGAAADCEYEFALYHFQVRDGAQLRLVVNAWSAEEGVKSEPPTLELKSPPFTLPSGVR